MPAIIMEHEFLKVVVLPEVGGRIIEMTDKRSGYQFIWSNPPHVLHPAGSEYDPVFAGGIDELLPSDIAEVVSGRDYYDHGELWTTPLQFEVINDADGDEAESVVLSGTLETSGLHYRREMTLRKDSPHLDCDYTITNTTDTEAIFSWKIHAPLKVQAGDRIVCPAKTAQVASPDWTRWRELEPFEWPNIEGSRADIIPEKNGTAECLYLNGLDVGIIGWERYSEGLSFGITFDTEVFPGAFYFASYGQFFDHYVGIIEPASSQPIGINDAIKSGYVSRLKPGEILETRIAFYGGSAEKDSATDDE